MRLTPTAEALLAPSTVTWDSVFIALTLPVAIVYAWPVLGEIVLPLAALRGLWSLFNW